MAFAHSEDDFTATLAGAVALLLMRLRSARHRFAAEGALRRELEPPDTDFAAEDADAINNALTESLRSHTDEHLDILIPLLAATSPSEFVGALEECRLPEDGQSPDFRANSDSDRRAELQAFYVAATRSSRLLLLTRALVRPTRYGDRPTEPSPYLALVAQATDPL